MSFEVLPVEIYGKIMEYMEKPYLFFRINKYCYEISGHSYCRRNNRKYKLRKRKFLLD